MNNYGQSPFSNITPVVKNLIIINVIFYLATFVLSRVGLDLVNLFSAHYIASPEFKPWQIITYMFMHDPKNIMHLGFNMFALFMFGPMLELTMGSKRFFNFYFITGIGALLIQILVQCIEVYHITGHFIITPQTLPVAITHDDIDKLANIYSGIILGASGAIFGLLVAFGMLYPNVELYIMFIPIPIKAKYVVMGYIAIELFSGIGQFSGDSVAHFAHLGGALFGFILIKIWGMDRPNNFFG
jgi:membrane associated rhomboid family serine protease